MVEEILNWVSNNPEWALVAVFLVSFTESVVILGLLVPGFLLLQGFGTFIGNETLPFWPLVAASFIGAVVGEYIGYWLGFSQKDRVAHWQYFQEHPRVLTRAKAFFRKYGILSIVLGRFFGPVRAVIPLVAGVSGMSQKSFFWSNTLSAMVWAPAYFIPGMLIGAAVAMESTVAYALIAVVIFLFVLAYFSVMNFHYWRRNVNRGIEGVETVKRLIICVVCGTAFTCVFVVAYLAFFGARSEYRSVVEQLLTSLWKIIIG